MNSRLLAGFLVSLPLAAWAGPAQNLAAFFFLYLVYFAICLCAVGWALFSAVVWSERVRRSGGALQKRPGASFFMGLLSIGWLLLSMGMAEAAPAAGILVLFTLVFLVGLVLLGLPALLARLGGGLLRLDDRQATPLRQIAVGGFLLFLAGGFPWLGQLLLLMAFLTAAGSALLSFVMAEARAADEDG